MIISYVNFNILAANEIDFTKLSDENNYISEKIAASLPHLMKSFTFNKVKYTYDEISLCSSNTNCSNKYLVKRINTKEIVSMVKKEPVMARIILVSNFNNKVEIRIPKSGNIGIKIGLSNYNDFELSNDNLELFIKKFLKAFFTNLKHIQIPNYETYSIANIALNRFKLFKSGRINKLTDFIKMLISKLGMGYEYRPPIESNRKQLNKIYIRSYRDINPTIGIFSTGTVDFNGIKNLTQVLKITKKLKEIMSENTMKNFISQ